ncbi:unnamed protein product [Aphanomyces euteiches]
MSSVASAAFAAELDTSITGWTSEVQVGDLLPVEINEDVPIEVGLQQCRARGYTRGRAFLDLPLDPVLVEYCNKIHYMEILQYAQHDVDSTDVSASTPVRIWQEDSTEQNYQDFFIKHVLQSHSVLTSDRLEISPQLVEACFDETQPMSSMKVTSPSCLDLLESFHVPMCVANDYLQRVNVSNVIALPALYQSSYPSDVHCRFGLHMALVSLSNSLSISVSTRSVSSGEFMLPLPPLDQENDPTLTQTSTQLDLGRVLFVPNGFSARFDGGSVLRFCFADASNLNRMKQHLRVEALLDSSVRNWLSAVQDATLDTTMTRQISLQQTIWSEFRTWPKPQKLTKESNADETLSRRERYKIWQEDRKWDSLVHGLTLPVSRPPLVVDPLLDIGRTKIALTWQDIYQPRKGDITSFGYEVTWSSDDGSEPVKRNLSSTILRRSALPTTSFGDDFDGKAIQGTIDGLSPNTSYTFSIRLFVGDSIGLHSERSAHILTRPCAQPSFVRGQPDVHLLDDDPNCVNLEWIAPEDDGGRAVTGYIVGARYSTEASAIQWRAFDYRLHIDPVILTESEEVQRGTACNLRQGFVYQFQVAAVNELGVGPFSIWTNPVEMPVKRSPDVLRGVGAPRFHRRFDPLELSKNISTAPKGPVMLLSDKQGRLEPFQFISLARKTAELQLDPDGRVADWSAWFATVWAGHFSTNKYNVVAEMVLADPVYADGPLKNEIDVRDRIAVILRGKLPIFNKVLHAQTAGALAVVLIDTRNQCEAFDHHCIPGSNAAYGEGFGALDSAVVWEKINIPHVLTVSKRYRETDRRRDKRMNLDLLWEYEKRRVVHGATAKKQHSILLDAKCIPDVALTDDKIFEKSGFALDYESHMSKRLNPPTAAPPTPPTHTATLNPTPSAQTIVLRTSDTIMSSPQRALHDLTTPKKKPLKVHDRLSLNSLLKTTHHHSNRHVTTDASPNHVNAPEERALKEYVGDFFSTRGEYVDGILYMSRMKKSASTSSLPPTQALDGTKLKETLASVDSDADADPASTPAATTQAQRCAATLANWSANPANARLMVNEGVVQAAILLSRSDDLTTRVHCGTIFMNLSAVADLRHGIIHLGAVKTLVTLLSSDDKALQATCALALCNLCCVSGDEATVVGNGAVSALASLMSDTPAVASISERALFNLTCVTEPYAQIDAVVKTFISIASSGQATTRDQTLQLCATAFANLSNLKRLRSRLMEEGIVSALAALLRSPSAHDQVKHLTVYVLCNLASTRSCRIELVTKGTVSLLVALSSSTLSVQTRAIIGNILCHLSKESSIRVRLVVEGLLSIVTAITTIHGIDENDQTSDEHICVVCATAIHHCSSTDEAQPKLVERDAIAVLMALGSASPHVQRISTLALCNLLMVKQAAVEIVGCGAVKSLVTLATQTQEAAPNSQLLYATALYNLCQNAISRDAIGAGGGVAAVSALCLGNLNASATSISILTLGAAALCYLAADANTRPYVATAPVVECVAAILRATDASVAISHPIQRFSVACLSMLSQDEPCAVLVLTRGAINAVLSTCATSRDMETKACCCDLLASLSFHAACRRDLISMPGFMASLTSLAKLRDANIQRRCATAIGNLSTERSVHDVLVTANIVTVLAVLSNSYSEESQSDCARALCNLSCSTGHEVELVNQGAVGVLFMICAVRAGSTVTKDMCARAIGNLLTLATLEKMLDEGLVKLLPAITKADTTSPIPATIFAKLLRHDSARAALCAEPPALRALFHYMQHADAASSTDSLFSSIAYDLVVHANTRTKAVADGLLAAMADLATRQKNDRLAAALLLIASAEDTRLALIAQGGISAILAIAMTVKSEPPLWMAVAALAHLSWHADSRANLDDVKISEMLVALLHRPCESMRLLDAALLSLANLSFRPDHANAMVNSGICAELLDVQQDAQGNQALLIGIILRQISHVEAFAAQALNRDTRPSIVALFCGLCDDATDNPAMTLDGSDVLCHLAFMEGLAPKLIDEFVVTAIRTLLRSSSSETLRRCAAGLCALSAAVDVRKALVDLGGTALLVHLAHTRGDVETLHCCSVALCNLSSDPRNARRMVADNAVSALHLSTIQDNDLNRDACSLALANLSHEAPTVASGSVAALIHMSMEGKPPSSTVATHLPQPPPITTQHHEAVVFPPEFSYPVEDYTAVFAKKYNADIGDRQPPVPHLPSITVDPDTIHASMDNPSGGSTDTAEELPPGARVQFSKLEPGVDAIMLNDHARMSSFVK